MEGEAARAIWDFEGLNDKELSFKAGDVIKILETKTTNFGADWWLGELNGRKGYFPVTYTEAVSKSDSNSSNSNKKPQMNENDKPKIVRAMAKDLENKLTLNTPLGHHNPPVITSRENSGSSSNSQNPALNLDVPSSLHTTKPHRVEPPPSDRENSTDYSPSQTSHREKTPLLTTNNTYTNNTNHTRSHPASIDDKKMGCCSNCVIS